MFTLQRADKYYSRAELKSEQRAKLKIENKIFFYL